MTEVSNNKQDGFQKLVDIHYKLKSKRHYSGDKHYSDYDVVVGFGIVYLIFCWIFFSLGAALIILPVLLGAFVLNHVNIVKREDGPKQ